MTHQTEEVTHTPADVAVPLDKIAGLKQNWRSDMTSGFILFLIALPLSLGIAMASGAPPMAGIITAIVGGIVVSQINGSHVTINGPAAGLIVVILASVERLGGGSAGYHATLGAIVISGILLFILGLCKAGTLGKMFPATVVHGMLSAIGLTIILKQLPFVLGVTPPAKEPLQLFAKIPEMFMHLNPQVALIGFVSMAILIVHNLISNKTIRRIPAPIVVVGVAIALSSVFGFDHEHTYQMFGHTHTINPAKLLVQIPCNPTESFCQPDWSHISTWAFWLSVISITLIQGVETLLSCAAVDRLDPYHRKSDLSKDMSAVGIGSAISGMLGGLPMIAEIVRSTANIANGAKTRWSNFFHGAFMLVFVIVAGSMINHIPLAALAALLVFTGYRLASPKVFRETHEIGMEQTFLFALTIFVTLATDLLIGVASGIVAKVVLHVLHGAPINRLFNADITVNEIPDGKLVEVNVKGAAIFSNFLSMKRALDKIPHGKDVRVDMCDTILIDHSVMMHLSEYGHDYAKSGGSFSLVGLDNHSAASHHALAARRRGQASTSSLAGAK